MSGFFRNSLGSGLIVAVMIASFAIVGVNQVFAAPPSPVSQSGAWTNVTGQAGDGSALAGTYTPGSGANRVMLVALTAEFSSPVSLIGVDAYFGGERFSRIEQNSPSGESQFAVWIGYINEAQLAAAADNNLTISWSDDQSATSLNLFAATFTHVNQDQPWKDKANNATALDAPIAFGADVDYKRWGKLIYIAGYGGTNAVTTHNASYTETLTAANFNGSVVTIAEKTDMSSNGTAPSSTSVDFGGTNSFHGLLVFSLNPIFNPLVHSSMSVGSNRWSGSGGWGVEGGKYGEFVCGTCHAKNTGNIKRVKNSISFPDSSTMPNGATNSVVDFQTTQAPTSDFGNDTGAHATSTKVCEICHTYDAAQNNGVKFHANDMSAGGADLSHENGNDCISCHLHSEGFSAGSCDGCHEANGVGHSDASDNVALHQQHTASNYTTACADCHTHNGSGGDHNNGTVNFNNSAISNTYNYPRAGAFGGTCGAVNGCHDSDADEWQNGDLAFAGDNGCQDCHGTSAEYFSLLLGWTNTAPAGPTSNRHQAHLANGGYVSGCTTCHPHDGSSMGGQHADGTLQETVNFVSADGTCANTCHYVEVDRDWNNGPALDCADCHDADVLGGQANGYYSLDGDGWPPAGGSHPIHIGSGTTAAYGVLGNYSTITEYEFGCGECHGTTASNHVNGVNNIEGGTLGYAGGSCSTASCHSHKDTDGVTTVYAPTPVWGGSFTGDQCAGCHKNSPESAGHEEHQMGFHSEHVYSGKKDFLPVTNADPLPANLILGPADNGDADSMDDSRDPLRGHGGRLADGTITSTIFTCYVCHNNTVTERYNDKATRCSTCHDDSIAPLMGTMTVADKRFHVNGVADVVFAKENIRSKAQVRDDLFDVPELSENWKRVGGYKVNDGSSYDEQPDTLYNMASLHGGWDEPSKTCTISCHLWEAGRVDKYPAHWVNNSIHGAQPIMCIDCHTRLPK